MIIFSDLMGTLQMGEQSTWFVSSFPFQESQKKAN
jgi:hypothetical protein